METLNKAANAAKQAFSGDSSSQSGREPVSGQTGAGTATQPYDAGNTVDNPRLGGLPGSDAGTDFSTGRDLDERSGREGGAYGGSTHGSDNPYQGATGTTGGGVYGGGRGEPASNTGPHSVSLANKLDPRIDSDGDGRGSSGPLDRESTTYPGTTTTGSGIDSSTIGQSSTTGNYSSTGGYDTIGGSGSQRQVIDDGPAASGVEGRFAPAPSSSTYSTGVTGSQSQVIDSGPASSGIEGRFAPSSGTYNTIGGSGTQQQVIDDGPAASGIEGRFAPAPTSSTYTTGVTGSQAQIVDDGPASSGIEGRFAPSTGTATSGQSISNVADRSAPSTDYGRDSSTFTGGSTAVDNSGSSGMTGSDDTSRNVSDQIDTGGSRGMTRGSTSTRFTGQDDTSTGPSGGMAQGANVMGDRPRPEHETDKTGVTSMHSNDPHFSDQRQTNANSSSVASRGQTRGPTGGFGAVEPSVSADPSSGQKPAQKHQGADRPHEEPSGEQVDAVKREKEKTEKQQAGEDPSSGSREQDDKPKPKKDPNDHSGQPLGTVDHSGNGEDKAPGQAGGDPHGEDKSNKGTGEKWVKTSGMAADGGDFDATKPGAGREADRLLEAKGIHREPGSGAPAKDPNAPDTDSGKGGVGDKIKGMLHLGSH